MTARAVQPISSPFGSFRKGEALDGVPRSVQMAWVQAGIAAGKPNRDEPETATAGAPEVAVTRKGGRYHPSESVTGTQKRRR